MHTKKSRKLVAATSIAAMLLGSLALAGCGNDDDALPPVDDEPPMEQPMDDPGMDDPGMDDPIMDDDTGVDEPGGLEPDESAVEEDPMMQAPDEDDGF